MIIHGFTAVLDIAALSSQAIHLRTKLSLHFNVRTSHSLCSPPPFWSPGSTDMSVLQLASEGRRAHQVLPRLLLRVRENALRYATEEVPQMQRRLRGERLPPHLHRLKMFPLNCFFRRKGNGFQQQFTHCREHRCTQLVHPQIIYRRVPVSAGNCGRELL